MLLGNSYWHAQQPLGTQFAPGQLRGYYNDLTAKTHWAGPEDQDGLPLNQYVSGNYLYFPTTLFQKALGHWDKWLGSNKIDDREREAFLKIAEWAVGNQDERGGWAVWPILGLSYASPYSAMTQGEGASVLSRAALLTKTDRYTESACLAVQLMLVDVAKGGCSRSASSGLVLEEAPLIPHNTMFNGWVFALYGLYDFLLLLSDRQEEGVWVESALHDSIKSLTAHLAQFDAGYWTYYDTDGNLASPFYHQLHIAQLKALEMTFPEQAESINRWRLHFERQADSRVNRMRAVACKAYQKLRKPPEVVLR